MPPRNDQLASFIRDHRAAAGFTMQQLADAVGTTKSNVHYWESGRSMPQPNVLPELAGALKIGEEDLFLLAGYARPAGLPAYSAYLRTKYGHLPADARRELEDHMRRLEAQSGGDDGDGA